MVDLFSKINMILSFAKDDFKSKYSGSTLGIFWAFVEPLFTVLVYWFVNHIAFRNNKFEDIPYIVWLIAGIAPWFFISGSWSGASGVFRDYSYLVKKVVFDVSCLPIIRIVSNFFVHLIFIFLIFLTCIIYKISIKLTHLQIVYYMFYTFFLITGASLIFCSLSVFLKDISNILKIFFEIGFWLTPIFWDENSVLGFNWVFKLNPIYYIVKGYRNTFIYGRWFFEDIRDLRYSLYCWIFSIIVFLFGKKIFKKTTIHIADLL